MLRKAKTARLVITFYRHITDKLPTSYRHITNCRPTVGRLIVYVLGKTCRPTDGRQSADSRPTDGRQSADRFFGELFFTITQCCYLGACNAGKFSLLVIIINSIKIVQITWVDTFKNAATNQKGSVYFILAVVENT